jgi:DNA primase
VDFKEIKEKVKIEDVADWLGLDMRVSQSQLRGECPACGSGGNRALAITPGKQSYYCWAEHKGGDLIALTAHIHGVSQKQAAEAIAAQFRIGGNSAKEQSQGTVPQPHQEPRRSGFDAESYGASLDPEHDAVDAVGFTTEVARALGLGYCRKGVLAGYVAVPLRLPDGTIAGFIGIQEAKLPSRWNLSPKVVPLYQRSA